MNIRKEFGKRIRQLRLNKGLSQEEFGDLIGLHRTYIGAIERGERNISLNSMIKVSAGLGITLEQLFRGIR